MRPHRIGVALAIPVFALVLGLTAACGSNKDSTGIASVGGGKPSAGASGATASPGADRSEQLRQFAQCMRDNGVDMADPDPSTGGFGLGGSGGQNLRNDPDFQKAIQACRSKLPNGGEPPKLNAEQLEQYRQWAQCMRDNGVDVPDPNPDGTLALGQGRGMGQFDRDNPTFQAAMKACQSKMPQFRAGGGS